MLSPSYRENVRRFQSTPGVAGQPGGRDALSILREARARPFDGGDACLVGRDDLHLSPAAGGQTLRYDEASERFVPEETQARDAAGYDERRSEQAAF